MATHGMAKCSYIKNTQILSTPETTSSHILWLGGHEGTGKKGRRPWPKVSSRTWNQTRTYTRCIVKISVETQGHQKKNEGCKNNGPIQDELPTGARWPHLRQVSPKPWHHRRKKQREWESCQKSRTSRIKFSCNLHINGVAANTSRNASRGNWDSWRTVSLADGMVHMVLGKYLFKVQNRWPKRCFWVRKLFWKESVSSSDRQIQPGENMASSGFWGFFGCLINYLQLTFKWEWIPQSPRETSRGQRRTLKSTAFFRYPRSKSPVQDSW